MRRGGAECASIREAVREQFQKAFWKFPKEEGGEPCSEPWSHSWRLLQSQNVLGPPFFSEFLRA